MRQPEKISPSVYNLKKTFLKLFFSLLKSRNCSTQLQQNIKTKKKESSAADAKNHAGQTRPTLPRLVPVQHSARAKKNPVSQYINLEEKVSLLYALRKRESFHTFRNLEKLDQLNLNHQHLRNLVAWSDTWSRCELTRPITKGKMGWNFPPGTEKNRQHSHSDSTSCPTIVIFKYKFVGRS